MIDRILFWLSLLLLFSIPWEDMVTLPVIGSMARLAGIIVFGAWAFKVALKGHIRKPHLFHILFYLFVIWNVASIFWTYGLDETRTRIITYVQLLIMTLILWDIYRSPAQLSAGLQAYVLGAWVGMVSMLVNFWSGVRIDAYEVGRYSASGVNAGDFVVILTLGIPMAWFLARAARPSVWNIIFKVVNYAYIPVSVFVVFLTGSRLALFTILPALLYVLLTTIQPKRILTSVLLVIVIVGALFAFLTSIPPETWERLTTVKTSITSADLGGRVPLWKESITAFSEHPIMGVGGGAFRVVNPYKSAAHNTYLSVLAELGLVGFLLFFLLLVIVFRSIFLLPRRELILWLTVFLILLIGITVQTWEFTKTTFIILSFIVMSVNLETQPVRSEDRAATTPSVELLGRI